MAVKYSGSLNEIKNNLQSISQYPHALENFNLLFKPFLNSLFEFFRLSLIRTAFYTQFIYKSN